MHSPIVGPILSQYNSIKTNTSTNTDQYKHQYKRIHTTSFLILAPVHANAGLGTVKSCASRQHSPCYQHSIIHTNTRQNISIPA